MATAYQYIEGVKCFTTPSYITHTVTADEDTANVVVISTPASAVNGATLTITRAGAVSTSDAVVTYPVEGGVSVANGATYVLTDGDIITMVTWGSAE